MGVASFKRSDIMGLRNQTVAEAKAAVQEYLTKTAFSDSRRLMWIVERATENVAEALEEYEQKLMVAQHFNHAKRVEDLNGYRTQYEQDFKFLYSMLNLIKEDLIKEDLVQKWGADLADCLNGKKSKRGSRGVPD